MEEIAWQGYEMRADTFYSPIIDPPSSNQTSSVVSEKEESYPEQKACPFFSHRCK